MVMTSQQISGMLANQNQMFTGMMAYSQQITPPMGGGPGMGMGVMSNHFMGPQAMGFNQGPQPMGPPPPIQSSWHPGMMGGMAMPFGPPGSGGTGAMAESLLGTGFAGASTMMQGAGTISGLAGLGSMGMGMLGLGGTGLGLALRAAGGIPTMAVLGAGSHVATSAYQGFQQRQQVNSVLRNRFGTTQGIGSGRGGMGFGHGEMGGISTMMREMGTEDLMTNTGELTRVLDRTAGTGLYRGVQSAREFKQKFQQTVDSLKEIAQIMHTTLEGASQMMEQQRGMGFFTGQDISRQLALTRVASSATGMSIGQTSAMAQQGAQLARATGGRGRVGAQAGVMAGSRIAMAQRMGYIDDDMMDFATGMTGAEGAQALSGRMQQVSQRFMSRRPGRAMVAGLWDPESGGISQERLNDVMSGSLSIRDLQNRGRRSIRESGGRRSEFFRDEEQLRSKVLAQGGEYLPMAVYGTHVAERRGLSNDDPIVQRMMRRRFRMSQGEVEAATEMMNNMPMIQAEMLMSGRRTRDAEGVGAGKELKGLRGLGKRLGRIWDRTVVNPFEQFADDLTTDVSKGIDDIVDTMEGRIGGQMSVASKQLIQERSEFGRAVSTSAKSTSFSDADYNRFMQGPISQDYIAGRDRSRAWGAMLGLRPDNGRMSGRGAYESIFDTGGRIFGGIVAGGRAISDFTTGMDVTGTGRIARDAGREIMGDTHNLRASDWAFGLRSIAKGTGIENYLINKGVYNPYQMGREERARALGFKGSQRSGTYDKDLTGFLDEAEGMMGKDIGLTRAQRGTFGKEYARSLTTELMDPQRQADWKSGTSRTAFGVTNAWRKMQRRGSPGMKTFAEETLALPMPMQVSRLQALEEEGGLSKSYRLTDELSGGGGSNRYLSYEEALEDIEGIRQSAYDALANPEERAETRKAMRASGDLRFGASPNTAHRVDRSYKDVTTMVAQNKFTIEGGEMEDFLADTAIREDFVKWQTSSGNEKKDAFIALSKTVETNADPGRQSTFGRMRNIEKKGTANAKGALLRVADADRALATEQQREVHRDLGKKLGDSMKDIPEEALGGKGSAEAWAKLQEVARLRASGTEAGIRESYAMENELLGDIIGTEAGRDIRRALSGSEGGEYVAGALQSGERFFREFSRGSNKTKMRNIFARALSTSDVDLGSEEILSQFKKGATEKSIMDMLSRGGDRSQEAIQKILAGAKGMGMGEYRLELLTERLNRGQSAAADSDITTGEGRELSGQYSGALAGQARSKSSAEKQATSEGQDKMNKHLLSISQAVRLLAGKESGMKPDDLAKLTAAIKKGIKAGS